MRSFFVHNDSVAVHVLESGALSREKPSLLVIGGLWEPAERAIPLMVGLENHVVALSLRGRGLSSTPSSGYDLTHHLSDIEAVVRDRRLKNYCVLGFSRGASYALGWTLEHQNEMAGLILVDQPPVHQRPGTGYVDYWSTLVYLGVPILNFMRREALEGLAREATEVDFRPRLHEIRIPVTLFVGCNRTARIPSDLSDVDLGVYRCAIAQCKVVHFNCSGHMIPDDEKEKYVAETGSFLATMRQRQRV